MFLTFMSCLMDIYLHLSQALMSICLSKIIVQMIFIILPKEENTCGFKVILIYFNINSLNFAMNSYPDDSFTVTGPTFVNINSWCLLNLSKILAFPLKKLKSSCSFAVKPNIDLCACNFQTVFQQGRAIKKSSFCFKCFIQMYLNPTRYITIT